MARDQGHGRGGRSGHDADEVWRPPLSPGKRSRSQRIRQRRRRPDHSAAVARQGASRNGGGLPHAERIQASFGAHDVSSLRAHTGSEAASAADALDAFAYAFGNDVVFGSQPDLHTAAHEAAHAVQQRGRIARGTDGPDQRWERHADAVADRVVAGQSAEDLLSQVADPARTSASSPTVQLRAKDVPSKTLYVGMGYHAREEYDDSLGSAPGADDTIPVLADGSRARGDRDNEREFQHGGASYDLTTDDGVRAYGAALGLDEAKQDRLVEIYDDHASRADSRDELSRVVAVMARAEAGEFELSRVAISGHNADSPARVYGHENGHGDHPGWYNGTFEARVFQELGDIFPTALAQIEHFMVSGCNSAGLDDYFELFPGLKTAWAYDGYSPATGNGAKIHLSRWEKSTRGEGVTSIDDVTQGWVERRLRTPTSASPEEAAILEGLREHRLSSYDIPYAMTQDARYMYRLDAKYHNVRTGDRESYEARNRDEAAAREELNDLIASAEELDDAYQAASRGEAYDSDALSEYFVRLQRIVQHDLADASWAQRSHRVFLLRHWSGCTEYFESQYGDEVRAAVAQLGIGQPDFGGMSRLDVLELSERWSSETETAKDEVMEDMLASLSALAEEEREELLLEIDSNIGARDAANDPEDTLLELLLFRAEALGASGPRIARFHQHLDRLENIDRAREASETLRRGLVELTDDLIPADAL